MMNATEMKNFVRDTAAQSFIDSFPNALAVNGKDYTYIIPIETPDGETSWAKVGITTLATAETKVRPAFDFDEQTTPAQEALDNMKAERIANAEAKALEKARKATK